MPFDPAPREPAVEVGRFQKYADAMLKGCATTRPLHNALADGKGAACALGAYLIGSGRLEPTVNAISIDDAGIDWLIHESLVWATYADRYKSRIDEDNDSGACTREQIAARIAAL